MVGLLKVEGTRFCVEFVEQHVQVFWHPAAPEAAAKARRWFEFAAPRLAQVPEHMLRSLVGSHAEFGRPAIRNEKTVELGGSLSDGGWIKLVYFKDRLLTDDEYNEGVETLETWARSYFG
jgi:hypothetical protein